jgi:hypothetical protein
VVVDVVPPAEPVLVVVDPPPEPLVVGPVVVEPLDVVPLVVVPLEVPLDVVLPAPPAPLDVVSPPVVRDEPPFVSLQAYPSAMSPAKAKPAKIVRKEVDMAQPYAARFGFLQEYCS